MIASIVSTILLIIMLFVIPIRLSEVLRNQRNIMKNQQIIEKKIIKLLGDKK